MGAAPTLPGAIGIVGGGQLSWMLAEAAQRRGVELVVQTPNPHDPAVALAARVVQADVRDAQATRQLAKGDDTKNIPVIIVTTKDRVEDRSVLKVPSYTRIGNGDKAKTWIFYLCLKQLSHYYLDTVCNLVAAV